MTVQATDPRSGWFAFVHHDIPIEYSWDIDERIRVIQDEKPAHERATRLGCLTYLPEEVIPETLRRLGRDHGEAGQAYGEAWRAWGEAARACGEARWAYDEKGQAYEEARRAEWPDGGLSIALAYVPNAPWDHELLALRFPPVPE